jgi:hypothetical protein
MGMFSELFSFLLLEGWPMAELAGRCIQVAWQIKKGFILLVIYKKMYEGTETESNITKKLEKHEANVDGK